MKIKIILFLLSGCLTHNLIAEYGAQDIEQEMQEDVSKEFKTTEEILPHEIEDATEDVEQEIREDIPEQIGLTENIESFEQELLKSFKLVTVISTGFYKALQSEEVKKLIEQERQRIEREQKSARSSSSGYGGYSRRRKRWW